MSISRIPAPTTVVTTPPEQLTDQEEQKVYNADTRHLLKEIVRELKVANLHNEDITGIEVKPNDIQED